MVYSPGFGRPRGWARAARRNHIALQLRSGRYAPTRMWPSLHAHGRRSPTVKAPWHRAFTPQVLRHAEPHALFAYITPEEAWGGATGRGVRVAVIDSGIEVDHPAVG